MKKGFTLVELLAVLVLLSIVVAIAATSYAKISKEQKVTACNNLKKQIENLAVEYVIDTNGFYNYPNKTMNITLAMLIKNGYIDVEDLENPVDGRKCGDGKYDWFCDTDDIYRQYNNPDNYVVVGYENGKYTSSFGGIACD